MAPARDGPPVRGREGMGRGKGSGFEREPESHAERAVRLLERTRATAASPSIGAYAPHSAAESSSFPPRAGPSRPLGGVSGKVAIAPAAESASLSSEPIALPLILKSLVNPALGSSAFSVKEAIPLAGKLVRAKLNTQVSLAHLNGPVLEEAGLTSELERHKTLTAFGVRAIRTGKGAASSSASSPVDDVAQRKAAAQAAPLSREAARAKRAFEGLIGKQSPPKRRRQMDDEALSREYGNVTIPTAETGAGSQAEYLFNEVLEPSMLQGRFAYVNRAPIMTTWTTLVLERLGFARREALSLAHCYVHTTSTSRGISIGVIPASERNRSVNVIGSNQPHFELMGVKIPLMKLGQLDEWRGISQGQVIGPDQAFNYMRRSMHQTLPLVMGALTLLADSYANSTANDAAAVKAESGMDVSEVPSPDLLHARAYELYTQFRPATAGEWGKKSMFYCDKALALRRGHDDAWAAWIAQHGDDDDRGPHGGAGGMSRRTSRGTGQSGSAHTDEQQQQQQAEAQEFENELRRLVDAGADGCSQTFVDGCVADDRRTDDDDKKSSVPAGDRNALAEMSSSAPPASHSQAQEAPASTSAVGPQTVKEESESETKAPEL